MRCILRTIAVVSLLICSQGEVVADSISGLSPGDILTATLAGSVVRVDPITGAQTVVSSGPPGEALSGIAINAVGSIFVTDLSAEIIRVDPSTGAQTIISSGNNLRFPIGITINAAGNLLVADRTANAVIQIDPITGAQAVVSSGGNLSGGVGAGPNGVAIDAAGNILVAGAHSGARDAGFIVRVDPITGAQTVVSSGGSLGSLNAVAIDAAGNLFVADGFGSIIRVDPITGAQSIVSSGLFLPLGIAIDAAGNILTDNSPFPLGVGSIIGVDPITGAQTIISSGGSLHGPAGIAIVPVPVPEPSTIVLCGIGILAVCVCRSTKRARRAINLPARLQSGPLLKQARDSSQSPNGSCFEKLPPQSPSQLPARTHWIGAARQSATWLNVTLRLALNFRRWRICSLSLMRSLPQGWSSQSSGRQTRSRAAQLTPEGTPRHFPKHCSKLHCFDLSFRSVFPDGRSQSSRRGRASIPA